MITEAQIHDIIGSTAYSVDGDKIGKVGQLFLDDQTGRPEFVTVNTGFFGTKESFVPVADATFTGDRLELPYAKERVKEAPRVDVDGGHLDQAEEQRLYEYYGMSGIYTQSADPMTSGMAGTDDMSSDTSSGMSGGMTSGTTSSGLASGPTTGMPGEMTTPQGTMGDPMAESTLSSEAARRARLRRYLSTDPMRDPVREPMPEEGLGGADEPRL